MKLVLLLVFFLSSCGIMRKAEQALDKINVIADRTNVSLSDVNRVTSGIKVAATALGDKGKEIAAGADQIKAAFQKADKDNSGTISGFAEWKELIVALGLVIVGFFTKKGVSDRLSQGKRDLHARIDKLQDEIKKP